MADRPEDLARQADEQGNEFGASPDALSSEAGPFTSAVDLFGKLNQTGGQFLLTDAETAHTFLDLAESTRDAERARREFKLAEEALKTIERFLAELELEPDIRQAIESSRDNLRQRLQLMRPRFG